MTNKNNYNDLKSAEGLSIIRHRPGQFVGSTGSVDGKVPRALNQIFQETITNSVDEATAGYGNKIDIKINKDNSVTISDEGRGVPMGKDFDAVIRGFTRMYTSGKYDSNAYQSSGGQNGIGIKSLTALSKYVTVDAIDSSGNDYTITFQQEKVIDKKHKKAKKNAKTGTTVTFLPDDTIFDTIEWDIKELSRKIDSQAYLTPEVTYHIQDERGEGFEKTYNHPGGMKDLVNSAGEGSDYIGMHEPLHFTDTIEVQDNKKNHGSPLEIKVEVGMVYTSDISDNIISFANSIPTKEGGPHVDGARNAITKVINDFATDKKLHKKGVKKIDPSDARDGVIMALSVSIPGEILQFESQTKEKLGTAQANQAVRKVVEDNFASWIYGNEKLGKKIIERAQDSAEARNAAKEARKVSQLARKKGNKKEKLAMSSKLTQGSGDPQYRELFIVEGDSAAGSVISARRPEVIKGKKVITQGVLAIRGKILNITGEKLTKILGNEEVRTIIAALGTGFGEEFDISKLQYDKIIICSDADDDGFHIRTLLTNVMWRLFPELVKQGHVYIANPPLFKFKTYKNGKPVEAFALNEKEYNEMKKDHKGWEVTRLKGLGEMDASALSKTTVTRGSRRLTQLTVEDAMELSQGLNLWTTKKSGGNASDKRKDYIMDNIYINEKDMD